MLHRQTLRSEGLSDWRNDDAVLACILPSLDKLLNLEVGIFRYLKNPSHEEWRRGADCARSAGL
eukprot:7377539-Prymnesium_polylepis.1